MVTGAANEYQNPFMPKNCEYLLLFAKNYDKRIYKPVWVKSDIDSAYSKIITNFNKKDFHQWQVSSVKKEYKLEMGVDPKQDDPKYYDYVLRNAHRIFQTIDPKGAGSGLRQAMRESKGSKSGWAVYERSDNNSIYTHKGRMVRFYSKNIQTNDGQKVIARELGSLWTDILWNGIANEGGVSLKNGKKPERLLKRIIEMSTNPGDIILDYHLGSGTTAAVAHKLGRQYIGIEQIDYEDNDAVARLNNVINGDPTGISKLISWTGGGSFVYCSLMDLGSEFIEKIHSASTNVELIKLLERVKGSSFLSYKANSQKINPLDVDFANLNIANKKILLLELVDYNHLYVNYNEIDDADYKCSSSDKKLNRQFYTT